MPLELLCVGNRLRESAAGGRWVLRVQPFAQWYLLNSAHYLDLFSPPSPSDRAVFKCNC